MLRLVGALGPGIPGTPIKKLPPFVTDTLFSIAGGPVQISRSHGNSPLGPNNQALTMAPLRPAQGDTGIVFYQEPTDHIAAHEVGHLIDHRNLIPQIYAAVEAKRVPYEGRLPVTQEDYFHSNREEYVAEAFARAVESGRHHQFADSTKAEKDMPGTGDIIRWLLTRSPFAKAKS